MIVASSSAFRRSLLPPNGSSIEADWSRRKMKHPGFFRLISALYMVAPFLRLLGAFDFVGLDLLGRDRDRVAALRRALLCFRGRRTGLREDGSGHRALAQETRSHPADQTERDESDPEMEQLEGSTDPLAPAGRTSRHGSPSGKPGQTASSAPQEALGQHGNGPRLRH